MFSLAAIVPHAPNLIDALYDSSIAPKTIASFARITDYLTIDRTDTIIFIVPHGLSLSHTTAVNVAEEFLGNLEQFGDLTHRFSVPGDPAFSQRLVEQLITTMAIQQSTDKELDYGSTIPLLFVKPVHPYRLVVIHPALEDIAGAVTLGNTLHDLIHDSNRKIAVFASVDLSMRHLRTSPAGFSPQSKKLDERIQKIFTNKTFDRLSKLPMELRDEGGLCGFSSLVALATLLSHFEHLADITTSYEVVEGTGLFTFARSITSA